MHGVDEEVADDLLGGVVAIGADRLHEVGAGLEVLVEGLAAVVDQRVDGGLLVAGIAHGLTNEVLAHLLRLRGLFGLHLALVALLGELDQVFLESAEDLVEHLAQGVLALVLGAVLPSADLDVVDLDLLAVVDLGLQLVDDLVRAGVFAFGLHVPQELREVRRQFAGAGVVEGGVVVRVDGFLAGALRVLVSVAVTVVVLVPVTVVSILSFRCHLCERSPSGYR